MKINFSNYPIKKIRLSIFILPFASLLIFACHKKKKEEEIQPYPDLRMPHEIMDFGYYKSGTYWIYQDSLSSSYDSVWVFNDHYQVDTLTKDNTYGLEAGSYDSFTIKTKSSHFNCEYYYWSNSSWATSDGTFHLRRQKLAPGILAETIAFIYPNQIGRKLGIYNNTVSVEGSISSISFFGNIFYNVTKINQTSDQSEGNTGTRFYFTKNIGIVKKEIPLRNENWKLIRFHIVQ